MTPRSPTIRALTDREEHVVELVAQGLTSKEIGSRLGISPRTAEAHVSRAAAKLPGNLPPRVRLICWWQGVAVEVVR